MLRLIGLTDRHYGRTAPALVRAAKEARERAVRADASVQNVDFHAAAVLSGGDHDTGDTYIETSMLDGPEKIPAIVRAISSMAIHGDRDVLLAVAYGGNPGEDPKIHAPCASCMRKLVKFDSDHSCDLVVQQKGGKLMLLNLGEFVDELDERIEAIKRAGGEPKPDEIHALMLAELQIA